MSLHLTAEEYLRALHDPKAAIQLVEAHSRRMETARRVREGLACPAPDCGMTYRHQHDEVWWPPEGEPWPPRREGT